MSDKSFIQDLVTDPKTWFGTVFTVVVGWITFILGAKKQRTDIAKTEVDIKAAHLETVIREDEYRDKKTDKLMEENQKLRQQLTDATLEIHRIMELVKAMEVTIKQLTLEVQEQQVKINITRTMKA